MKGFPSHFATKEDFKNIIRDFPQWRGRVMKELKALKAIKDDKVTRAVRQIDPNDPESEWITEKIDNPSPVHKQKGFKTKKELNDLSGKVEIKEKKEVKAK